jgi:hypothetical protein
MQDTERALLRVPNSQVINMYIKYVIDNGKTTGNVKWQNCNQNSVVDNFCEIISKKTKMKNLNPSGIRGLIDDMNDIAKTRKWKPSQRIWAIDKLCNLAGQPLISHDKTALSREWFTPSDDPLTVATMASATAAGGNYEMRKFTDKPSALNEPFATTTNLTNPTMIEQIMWSQTISPFNTSPHTIKSIERKKCGTCWMCEKFIYVYKITLSDNSEKYISCGQDEHILPPGWGNIVGVLWSDLQDQTMFNVNTNRSLAPSHSWCNQLKGDEIFIKLPHFNITNTFINFSINQEGINRFTQKGIKWLNPHGKTQRYGHDMHQIKHTLTPQNFMNEMIGKMTNFLGQLITELNQTAPTAVALGGHNYDVFMLRTTLCLAYMWDKIIHHTSGGGQTGGTNFYAGKNLNTHVLGNIFFDYRDIDKKVYVRNKEESHRLFSIKEASIICSIKDRNTSLTIDTHEDVQPPNSWEQMNKEEINFHQEMFILSLIVGNIISAYYLSSPEDEEVELVESFDSEEAKNWAEKAMERKKKREPFDNSVETEELKILKEIVNETTDRIIPHLKAKQVGSDAEAEAEDRSKRLEEWETTVIKINQAVAQLEQEIRINTTQTGSQKPSAQYSATALTSALNDSASFAETIALSSPLAHDIVKKILDTVKEWDNILKNMNPSEYRKYKHAYEIANDMTNSAVIQAKNAVDNYNNTSVKYAIAAFKSAYSALSALDKSIKQSTPQGGAHKIGKNSGVITINQKSINTKKHKSRKHKSKKSRKHKFKKSRKHKSKKSRKYKTFKKKT